MVNPAMHMSQHSWWPLLIRGLIAVILGLIVLFVPSIALLALIYTFGFYALFDGILAMVAAFESRHYRPSWGWLLIEGLAGVLIGVMAFTWPGETALILLYIVAFWAIITGVFEIAAAIGNRDWLIGLAGVVSLLFGIVLFSRPLSGLLSVLWVLGIYAIIFGITLMVRGVQLRVRGTPETNRFSQFPT